MKLTPENLTVCINTYNRQHALVKCIETLQASMPDGVQIIVISNHSKGCAALYDYIHVIGKQCQKAVRYKNVDVLQNTLRHDESWGHLSRSWNQCIMQGLLRTENVLFCQDDVEFKDGWWDLVSSTTHEYYCAPLDGQIQLMSRAAFLKVGWYDERFVGIDFEGYDYLNRVWQTLPQDAVIEDRARGIIQNQIGLSDYWIAHCDDEADRPRGEEKAHARMNRHWLAKKRGLDTSNPQCHKDPKWRDVRIPYVVDNIDWYPWACAKIQQLAGIRQTFCSVPWSDEYGHTGYGVDVDNLGA